MQSVLGYKFVLKKGVRSRTMHSNESIDYIRLAMVSFDRISVEVINGQLLMPQ